YVVASGAVKSVGVLLLNAGIGEAWMPAATGALFLPVFFAAVYGLSLMPPPSPADVAARTARAPMGAGGRRAVPRADVARGGVVVSCARTGRAWCCSCSCTSS